MDFQSLTAAHRHPQNQLRFDAQAFDQAVLRAEGRRAVLHRAWTVMAGYAATLVAQGRARSVGTRPAASGAEGR